MTPTDTPDVDRLYAPPKVLSGVLPDDPNDSELRVEGNVIVSPKESIWPDRCVVCNHPSGGFKLKRKLYWHHPAIYLLILIFSAVLYLIVAIIVRKTATIHVGLCEKHRARRRNGLLIGWLGFFGSLALLIGGIGAGALLPYFMVAGIIGLIVFPIVGMVMSQVVRPTRIDDTYLWATAGKPFIDSLR